MKRISTGICVALAALMRRHVPAIAAIASILCSASASAAQAQPAAPPVAPPVSGVAPPGYAPPPSLPPAYYYPPPPPAPRVIRWNEGEDIPPGYHKASQIRKGLVIAGSIMFGTAWLPTAIVGSFAAPLAIIPLAGPVAAGVAYGKHTDGTVIFWLVFDTVQQAAGLTMLTVGLTAREPVLFRNDVREAKVRWLPVPMSFGNGSGGLGIAGTF